MKFDHGVVSYHKFHKTGCFWFGLLFLIVLEGEAQAGMSVLELSDLAKFRLESISFFLACFLLCSFVIYKLWGYLRKDFSFLPLLTYKKSVVLTGLWGLVVLIVLTMISGARELMTPGAWKKKEGGATYELVGSDEKLDQKKDSVKNLNLLRQARLEKLQGALWYYASRNEGHFPDSVKTSGIPEEFWKLPEKYEITYQYFSGLKPLEEGEPKIVVLEEKVYQDDPLALLNNGTIRPLTRQEWIKLESERGDQ